MNNIKKNLNLFRIILQKNMKGLIFFTCIFTILIGALTPIITWIYKILFEQIDIKNVAFNRILVTILLYESLHIIVLIFSTISNHLSLKVGYIINNRVSELVSQKLFSVELEKLENPETYNLLERVSVNTSDNMIGFFSTLIELVTGTITICIYSVMLISISPVFILMVVIAAIIKVVVSYVLKKQKLRIRNENYQHLRKMDYFIDVLSSRSTVKDIRHFGLIEFFLEKYKSSRKIIQDNYVSLFFRQLKFVLLESCTGNLLFASCIFISCILVMRGANSISTVILLINIVQYLLSELFNLSQKFGNLAEISILSEDWASFRAISENSLTEGASKNISSYDIEFNHVTFSYPGKSKFMLKDISFSIKEGEKVAIVGSNGSGKSTLMSLILGFYKIQKGVITIGGKNIYELNKSEKEKIVCVFQNFLRMQSTIRENICFDNKCFDEADFSYIELEQLLDSYVEREEHILGQLEENASELSGGQWQKIAIARGLNKKNSHILVLDEPTASLDPHLESKIYENISKLGLDRTLIFVSHRLGVTKLCDKIIVMHEGQIVEIGTHHELMEKSGLYYDMYKKQQSLYF